MGRMLVWVGATLGGWAGWSVAAGFGIMPAFLASIVGTALGVYAGRRLQQYFGA